MGARDWHVARAKYHKKVADYLAGSTDYEDWALVALYYSALHFVDSILADDPELSKDERHPRKHSGVETGQRGRNQLVRTQLPGIRRPYRNLEEVSRRTRYDVDRLSDAERAFQRFEPHWSKIKTYADMMHATRPQIPSEAP